MYQCTNVEPQQHHAGPDLSDPKAISRLPQAPRNVLKHMSNVITGVELAEQARRQRSDRALGKDGVSMAVWKFLLNRERANALITDAIAAEWTTGSYPGEHEPPEVDADETKGEKALQQDRPIAGARPCKSCDGRNTSKCTAGHDDRQGRVNKQWTSAKGIAVYKPGKNREQLSGWRTIGIQDGLASIVSSVIRARISAWSCEQLPQEYTGFRPGVGVRDALWAVHRALRQRRKQKLESWVAFLDIVGAFDKISRSALFSILLKFGFPNHFVNILRRAHRGSTVVFTIGGRRYGVRMETGVRTGDCAGPDLFMICILAVTSEMEWPEEGAPIFTDGRHEEFDFKYICFADDFFLCFETREALQDGLGRVIRRIQKMTGMSVHFATTREQLDANGSKTVAMRCTPEGEYHHDIEWEPLEVDVGGAKKGYVQVVSQHRYLGTVVHFDLGSEAAIRARIRAARGALSKAVKALRVKELDARVKGKLLVATIMNVLLYGSETWLIRAEDKLRLNTFWNDACRLAVGTTRAQAISSGFTLKLIRRKLGVEDVDYYLRHRLLNWFGCMARMDQNQLPQRFLWSKPKCPGQNRVTTTSVHQKSIKGETTRAVPAAVGGRWCAEGATAMAKRPKGPEAGMTATSGQSQTEEGSMTHRWSAELCRRSTRCRMTGETMLKGTLRFTQHARRRRTDGVGRAFDRYFSVRAMAAKLSAAPSLRGRLKKGLTVQGILSEKQKAQITTTITAEVFVDPRGCVAEPMVVPWSCPRCGKMYKCKLAMAKKHAQLATCTAPKNKAEKCMPTVPVPQRVYGRRRNITVEQRIYNLIREEELVSKRPYSGCRICKSGNICGPCRLVEAFKLARNHPKVWHDIIYKDEDQTSAASQRRRSKLKKATGSWDDIRWWQHDNKGSNWWNEWRRTYVSVTRIIRELKKNDEVQGAD